MVQKGQEVLQVPLEHLGHFDHGLEPAATNPTKPIFEKAPGPTFLLVLPELGEQFLGRPGSRHF